MTTTTNNNSKVIERFVATNGEYINNHFNGTVKENCCAIAELKNGTLAAFYDNTKYFSLNKIYISERDNELHLSSESVAGAVEVLGTPERNAIRYNKSLTNNKSGNNIQIVKLWFADGTVIDNLYIEKPVEEAC